MRDAVFARCAPRVRIVEMPCDECRSYDRAVERLAYPEEGAPPEAVCRSCFGPEQHVFGMSAKSVPTMAVQQGLTVLLAKDSQTGDVVGYVYVDLRHTDANGRPAAFLCSLCVDSDARRGGIGRALVHACKRLALAHGRSALCLTIRPAVSSAATDRTVLQEHNRRYNKLRDFYVSQNFRATHKDDQYHYMQAAL